MSGAVSLEQPRHQSSRIDFRKRQLNTTARLSSPAVHIPYDHFNDDETNQKKYTAHKYSQQFTK